VTEPAPAGPPAGPLAGIRVLDLTSVIMGPLATQILGDLGAEVITVEPGQGETNRVMGAGPHRELSGISLNLLRNKRNIVLDLRSEAGRSAFLRIAATCDVVVTNLRPGPLGRLRLTYDDVRAVRPDIVFCQAHGWATGSGREDDPAFDDIIQAASGMSELNFRVTGERLLTPTLVADKTSGLTIVYSVLAALLHRERTGEGQKIEVPMADVTAAFMLVEHGAGAIPEPPLAKGGYERVLSAQRRSQPTADGWLNVLPFTRDHYQALFAEGGRLDLLEDERLRSARSRIAHSESLYADVAPILLSKTTAEWMVFFRDHDMPATPMVTVDDLVGHLPLGDHPTVGRYRVIPPPVRFSATPASVRRHAPLVGEHTVEVLREVGLTEAEIAAVVQS
jgi:crotonobetainyl-CoA:carnitine CoA-transferase CaiB-like acyl-CoA transferase